MGTTQRRTFSPRTNTGLTPVLSQMSVGIQVDSTVCAVWLAVKIGCAAARWQKDMGRAANRIQRERRTSCGPRGRHSTYLSAHQRAALLCHESEAEGGPTNPERAANGGKNGRWEWGHSSSAFDPALPKAGLPSRPGDEQPSVEWSQSGVSRPDWGRLVVLGLDTTNAERRSTRPARGTPISCSP